MTGPCASDRPIDEHHNAAARRVCGAKPRDQKYEIRDDTSTGLGLATQPTGMRTFVPNRMVRRRRRAPTSAAAARTPNVSPTSCARAAPGLRPRRIGPPAGREPRSATAPARVAGVAPESPPPRRYANRTSLLRFWGMSSWHALCRARDAVCNRERAGGGRFNIDVAVSGRVGNERQTGERPFLNAVR